MIVKTTIVFFYLYFICNINGYITRIAVRLPLEGTPAAPGAPWPLPQVWDNSSYQHTLDPHDFTFVSNFEQADIIQQAFERYSKILQDFDPEGIVDDSLNRLSSLRVTVLDLSYENGDYPSLESNETYELSILDDTDQVTLQAESVWGVLRGLETFSQLLFTTPEKKFQINSTDIVDWPRFAYRGFMVDTSRHFMPMSVLNQHFDAMAYNKFNVFHWHVVDDQSFPYPSRTFPNLTEYGSYHPALTYSREDVAEILENTRLRGIRVIPEFDTPGHTYSWGLALPDLITPCWGEGLEGGPNVPNYPEHGPREILNPMEEYTYNVLDDLYREIKEDFPDQYVHLGMDEAYYACWESNPNITEWMVDMNFTTYSEVEQYYSERLIDIAANHQLKYIIWEDPINNNVSVSDDTLVEMWKDTRNDPENMKPWQEYTLDVATQGYKMILAAPWYLNVIDYGQDWRDLYLVEPTNFTDDSSLHEQMIGGETCAWMEYMDGNNFLSRVWPRASAVGEVLWSAKGVEYIEDAQYRLDQQRCRMIRRGISAQPLMNGYCGDYEWGLQEEDIRPETGTASFMTSQTGFIVLIYICFVIFF